MAARRALVLIALAITLLPALFSGGAGSCHATSAGARPANAAAAAEMPCHPQQPGADRPSLRAGAPDCCTGHAACGACGAPVSTPVRLAAIGRQHERAARAADGAALEVFRDGRALDHVPLA
jgi:hypothetical protein